MTPLAKSQAALKIFQAESPAAVETARELFREYGASLGFSLCFQSFDEELAGVPGEYAPPSGRLLLAESDGRVAGCVALHRLIVPMTGASCEMKRLYVRPEFRGHKIGLALAHKIIADAREIGYARMLLDTVPSFMAEAVKLYRSLGFREISPYCHNPVAGAIFMELEL